MNEYIVLGILFVALIGGFIYNTYIITRDDEAPQG